MTDLRVKTQALILATREALVSVPFSSPAHLPPPGGPEAHLALMPWDSAQELWAEGQAEVTW